LPNGLDHGDDVAMALSVVVVLSTEQLSHVTSLRHFADRLATSLFVSFVMRLYAEGCVFPAHGRSARRAVSLYGDRAQ
jgi:hypothetical protein